MFVVSQAPEILEAKEYDGKADLWSIGCIFFEMLVGTCPFKGMNEADLLNNIRTKSLRIPGSIEIAKLSFDILGKVSNQLANATFLFYSLHITLSKFSY